MKPSIWYAIPTKRPPGEDTIEMWRALGYKIALFVDEGDPPKKADRVIVGKYEGYAKAVNYLVKTILAEDPAARWIVTGGDDVEPGSVPMQVARGVDRYYAPNHLDCYDAMRLVEEAVAETQRQRQLMPPGLPRYVSSGTNAAYRLMVTHMIDSYIESVDIRNRDCSQRPLLYHPLFSVCQPTGDRWAESDGSAPIDRVAGSPWMGRLFCERMYGGIGPLFHGYFHMFVDEELQNVAQRLGVFAQQRQLTQKHRHWQRVEPDEFYVSGVNPMQVSPPHLAFANSRKHWDDAKLMFNQRLDENFPNHAPVDWSLPA